MTGRITKVRTLVWPLRSRVSAVRSGARADVGSVFVAAPESGPPYATYAATFDDTYLVDDEMQRLSFAAARQHVVARLRTAVAHQKVSVAPRHQLFGLGSRNAPVVPGVRPQVPRVQTQLPFQRVDGVALRPRRFLSR